MSLDLPLWERFRSVLEARHPEWAPCVRGGTAGGRRDTSNVSRFCVEIPSEHPTIREPLTIEIAGHEHGEPIDVYWNRYFEHVVPDRTLPVEARVGDQFDRALAMVEEWTDEARAFAFTFDLATGRRTGWGRLPLPFSESVRARLTERAERIEFWSWRGTRDGAWSPGRPEAA